MKGVGNTVPATKAEALRLLAKAEEFLRGAQAALRGDQPNSAGLLAIHAAISGSDALTAHFLGKRSSGQRHHDVLGLLRDLPIEGKERLALQVGRLLDDKNTVEYEDKILFRTGADEMVSLATRVVAAARKALR